MNTTFKYINKMPGLDLLLSVGRMIYSLVKCRSLKTILFSPPGHFYSPLPNLKEIKQQRNFFPLQDENLPGIDLQKYFQLEILKKFSTYYQDLPFSENPEPDKRYYYSNGFFSYGDAIILYCFLRHFKPRHIIEIGSGFSSAVMLDTNERFLDSSVKFTFIDPYPNRISKLLSIDDQKRHELIDKPVQKVPLEIFGKLKENDILFIDSSHVVKYGSDVAFIIFHLLPSLKAGVIIHFHDILWPFEYPETWVINGRSWNEAYFLRAFLQYNRNFEILYFNSFMGKYQKQQVEKWLPLCIKNIGGSLWIRKQVG